MEGINFNGVIFLGTVERDGREYANVLAPVSGNAIKVTEGGNDLLSYAKIPQGNATVQITSWKDGSLQAVAAAKAAKKAEKVGARVLAKPHTELVKR